MKSSNRRFSATSNKKGPNFLLMEPIALIYVLYIGKG
jgi:hypothetical protein